jgi:hypothetical protein
VVEELYQHFE